MALCHDERDYAMGFTRRDPHAGDRPRQPTVQEARAKAGHCPMCDSPAPHLHPAVQYEGEVSPCADPFHHVVTPENTEAKIADCRCSSCRPF
jgi:hypothetical protein